MYNARRQELSYRAMIVENTGVQALGLASFFLFFFLGRLVVVVGGEAG